MADIVNSSDHKLGAELAGLLSCGCHLVNWLDRDRQIGHEDRRRERDTSVPRTGRQVAFIILDDADLGAAASMAAFTVSTHAGQGCALTTRLLVPRAKLDEVAETGRKHNGDACCR